MRIRMPSTTRNRVLLGVSTAALLYVTLATIYGDNWRPFTNDIEETATSAWNGFTGALEDGLRWMLETEINPATILIGFLAWLLISFTARRVNRRWKLTGHAATALTSNGSKATGKWAGIVLGTLVVLGALGIGGAYGGVALGDNLRPQIVSAYDTSERWVGDRIDDLTGKNEPAAAPANPAAPTGDTRTEAPTDTRTTAPTDDETEAPADTRTESPAGETRTETPADTRTDASDDKPVTDALSGVLTDADRIATDPVKFAEDNPLRAAIWSLVLLVILAWLIRRPFAWRRHAQLNRKVKELDEYANEDISAIAALRADVDELQAGGPRVAGGRS